MKIKFITLSLMAMLALSACGATNTPATTAAPKAAAQATQTSAPVAAATVAATSTAKPAATAAAIPTTVPVAAVTATTATASSPASVDCSTLKLSAELTEGPYYKANPPQKNSLVEANTTGTRVVMTGYVLTADCKPVANAKVDVWQADEKGSYDNSGYKYRGYVMTDANGKYSIETVIPGEYPGRTEHIHVKVWLPSGKVLTTQVFFPGQSSNASDGIYTPNMLATMSDTATGKQALMNFVVKN
ncbi:MAG TPA: hypothetical protein PLJ62_06025 [Thermoflexales bacterium]|nr:hypothetical protein [Thermoflexales bacterium]HQW34285.1 hypothetical protein [Thermoflexales bacterium]HQZ21446.1 hypothetical protein [Thermoflexales bacterium]HQZ99733.1 hypothetical protein [Thermoflexales bacterium]